MGHHGRQPGIGAVGTAAWPRIMRIWTSMRRVCAIPIATGTQDDMLAPSRGQIGGSFWPPTPANYNSIARGAGANHGGGSRRSPSPGLRSEVVYRWWSWEATG